METALGWGLLSTGVGRASLPRVHWLATEQSPAVSQLGLQRKSKAGQDSFEGRS